jgi:hypothetical protein
VSGDQCRDTLRWGGFTVPQVTRRDTARTSRQYSNVRAFVCDSETACLCDVENAALIALTHRSDEMRRNGHGIAMTAHWCDGLVVRWRHDGKRLGSRP